ncbi:MAG TPA: class F sortase [Candidatus Paceibacterota bacterium]
MSKLSLGALIAFIILCALSPIALFFIVPRANVEARAATAVTAAIEKPAEEIVRAELPSRIRIPRLGINAHLEHVGIKADGSLDAPKDPFNAAWFAGGPRPGEIGSAVIDGHYGWIDDVPAVFDNLNSIVKGDRIYVIDVTGSTTAFTVTEVRVFDKDADATSVFVSNDGKARLNLITCEGAWNETTQKYSGRLVVFAEK